MSTRSRTTQGAAAPDYLVAHVQSLNKYGPHASFDEIYNRERDLVGLFTSAGSSVDTTCYAIWALASHPSVLHVAEI